MHFVSRFRFDHGFLFGLALCDPNRAVFFFDLVQNVRCGRPPAAIRENRVGQGEFGQRDFAAAEQGRGIRAKTWNESRPFDKVAGHRRVPRPFRFAPSRRSSISRAPAARSSRLRNDCRRFPVPIRPEFRSFRRSSPRDYRAANLRPAIRDTFPVQTPSRKRTASSPSRRDVSPATRDRIDCARNRARQPAPECRRSRCRFQSTAPCK